MGRKKKKPRKKNKSAKPSSAKREKMFQAFCETGTEHNVRKKCATHWTTVKKYRKLDDWDARYARIQEEARKKADARLVTQYSKVTEHFRALRDAGLNKRLREIKEQLEKGENNPILGLTINEIIALDKHLELREGRPDSRPDIGTAELDPDVLEAIRSLADKLGSTGMAELGDELADDV